MTNADKDPRPKYLNLLQIRLPVTGIVSIAHRLSGVLLVISIPAGIYLLQHSLGGPDEFSSLSGFFSSSAVRLVLLLIVMAVAYHLFAGIRFLLIDLGVGEHLPAARRGAWSVLGATFIAFLLALFVMI